MTLQTDKRDEALLEDVASLLDTVASLFDMYAHDSEALANRGLDLRRNSERAKVWREAAAEVRSIKLV
jgi:hypothetical protein